MARAVIGRGVFGVVVEEGADHVLKCNTHVHPETFGYDGLHELAILTCVRGHPFISSLVKTPHQADGSLPLALSLDVDEQDAHSEYHAPCAPHQPLFNRFGLVFERAPLGDMDKFILSGELEEVSTRQRQDWIGQLASAIAFCHRQGIVHRDISSKNVLIVSETRVQLTDFGLARALSPAALSVTQFFELFPRARQDTLPRLHSDVMGAPIYAAPEVMMGMPFIGFKGDVWAFGMLAFEIATGGSHLLELPENYIPETPEEPGWMGALRSLFLAHPVRPSPDHFLFTDRRRARPPLSNLWLEKRTGKEWDGWVRSAWRGPSGDTPPEANAQGFFNRIFDWSPETRPGMDWVIRHPWIRKIDAGSPGVARARVACVPSRTAHPEYTELARYYRFLTCILPRRLVRVQEWHWASINTLERVKALPTPPPRPDLLAFSIVVWTLLLHPVESNDTLKRFVQVHSNASFAEVQGMLDYLFVSLNDFEKVYETPLDVLMSERQPLTLKSLAHGFIDHSSALLASYGEETAKT